MTSELIRNHYFIEDRKDIPIIPICLLTALLLTLSGSDYPCLEQISMVPKMFEPLKFDCNYKSSAQYVYAYLSCVMAKLSSDKYKVLTAHTVYASWLGHTWLNSFGARFQTTFVACFFILTNYRLERHLYVKLKNWMSNSVDPDETSQLDLCCLQKPIIIARGSERIKFFLF